MTYFIHLAKNKRVITEHSRLHSLSGVFFAQLLSSKVYLFILIGLIFITRIFIFFLQKLQNYTFKRQISTLITYNLLKTCGPKVYDAHKLLLSNKRSDSFSFFRDNKLEQNETTKTNQVQYLSFCG